MKRLYKHTGQALAVAAVSTLGMGAAQAYEWQINPDTTFGIGGTVELAYTVDEDTNGNHSRELIDNGSGLVFSGEHAFTNNLSAYFEAELDYAFDEAGGGTGDEEDEPGANSFHTDHAYFGVTSDKYGTIQIGNWDGIYDNTVRDLMDVFEVVSVGLHTANGEQTIEAGDAVAYFSPSYQGLSFAVQGNFHGADNGTPGQDGHAFQGVVSYDAQQFSVHLGYHDQGLDQDADGIIGVGASVDLAPITLAGKIEHVGEDSSYMNMLDKEGYMSYGIAAAYDYGPGAITGAVRQIEPKADSVDSQTKFGVNVNYYVADNFYLYIEHAHATEQLDNDNESVSAAGMVYTF